MFVEGEAAFADVLSGFMSPDVGFFAFRAWCAEFDAWLEEGLDLANPPVEVFVQGFFVLLVVAVDGYGCPLLDALM